MRCPCCGDNMDEDEKDSIISYVCKSCGLRNSELKKDI